jgi:hypothetical protein
MQSGETTRYLGFHIGFQVSAEKRFSELLFALRKKLSYWCTIHLSLASCVLIANQILLSSIWYVASCWSPHLRLVAKVVSLIRNYIWSSEDGSRLCPAKVAWSSLILLKSCGGIKLIDPELQMKALLTKLYDQRANTRASTLEKLTNTKNRCAPSKKRRAMAGA